MNRPKGVASMSTKVKVFNIYKSNATKISHNKIINCIKIVNYHIQTWQMSVVESLILR